MGYVNTVHIIYVSDAPIRDFGNYPISHYLIQLLTDIDSRFDVSILWIFACFMQYSKLDSKLHLVL